MKNCDAMAKLMIAIVVFLLIVSCQAGHEPIDRNMRIVGGLPSRVGQFPHAVALILHLTESRSSFCGGSIIHRSYVLTVS
jgi:secreted trypsin-like serine protease